MTRKTEIILLRESWRDSLISDAATLTTIFAPIGLGVWLESAAMQWAGFLMFLVSVVGRASAKTRDGRMSVDEAIERLQAIKDPQP